MSVLHLPIELSGFGDNPGPGPSAEERTAVMEFHIAKEARVKLGVDESLFSLKGNVILANFSAARNLAARMNGQINPIVHPEKIVKAGRLAAMGLIDEILHYVAALYREKIGPDSFSGALKALEKAIGKPKLDALLERFCADFPPLAVHRGELNARDYLAGTEGGEDRRALALEELLLLRLANDNPAFAPFASLFDDRSLRATAGYGEAMAALDAHFAALPGFGPKNEDLVTLLRSPAVAEPLSLTGQLDYIRSHWGLLIASFLLRLLTALDVVKEEEKPVFSGPGPTRAYVYDELEREYERFTEDKDWMPRTVLMAKSVLVWLHQLTVRYGRTIDRLDLIPDEELDELARRGFTGLWLIGLWERSVGSKEIKRRMGNQEAAASAYSLYDYEIAAELGGWVALKNLRERCAWRGIRLGSDMVPNHTGIDSRWIMERPELFLQLDHPPFPSYSFGGENLSSREGVGVYLEDHYWNKSDAAVVFKRVDFSSGHTRYIYHGNDGTSMPWNDTAQIDFLNPAARRAVQDTILRVCREFPIVRFDAAMTLAKKHIQRLWYPEPGHGGAIPSRSERSLSRQEFERAIPEEFWREVVDRCAQEAPDTLLLAEAFWMMEGYFVRTLGMHRVYNSAFMNMLKNEENGKYRATIKNTLEFDPEILKRFVNFMNNPDEETAVAQFGRGDKYFGVCTLMSTMPGLPMFGHGQLEGFEEKYGMEFRRSYRDEKPDADLIARHEREIFPLLKRRALFSGSADFSLFDLQGEDGGVNENVFAYSNRAGDERCLVLYNNAYPRADGWLRQSSQALRKKGGARNLESQSLASALGASGAGDEFLIMREQRSNLWFIRESSALAQGGLFISLNGYETQVFLDVHMVRDDGDGRYRALCAALDGRGTPDIATALQDLFLKDLYGRFLNLLNPSYFKGFEALLRGDASGRTSAKDGGPLKERLTTNEAIEAFLETHRVPFLDFVARAADYVDGASGAYAPFDRKEAQALPPDALWTLFSNSVRRAATLARWSEDAPEGLSKEARGWLEAASKSLEENPRLPLYLAGYLVLAISRGIAGEGTDGEDGRRLVDHWCLDRKLREVYGGLGIAPDEAYRTVTLMKLILSRSTLKGSKSEGKELATDRDLAKQLATDVFTSDDGRAFLGVHIFDDVPWFNKERFEEALCLGAIAIAADKGEAEAKKKMPKGKQKKGAEPVDSATVEALETVARVSALLEEAERVSAYRVDTFLSALTEA